MKSHHFSGLIFGIVTLTWVSSGLLSMSPVGGGRGQARKARHTPASPPAITLEQLRTAHGAFANVFPPQALRMTHVDGESYWVAERAPRVTDADSGAVRAYFLARIARDWRARMCRSRRPSAARSIAFRSTH